MVGLLVCLEGDHCISEWQRVTRRLGIFVSDADPVELDLCHILKARQKA